MIFISYRRDDSIDVVGRMYDRLITHFPVDKIFRDLDSISPGETFPDVIRKKLSESCVALVVIGPKWLQILHERKDQSVDHVRDEIRLALESGIVVIPITVSNATMPTPIDLAEFPILQLLALIHCMSVRPDPDFNRDLQRLIRQLSRIPGIPALTGAAVAATTASHRQVSAADRLEAVLEFLERLALNGLKENVVYLPPKLKPEEGEADKPESRVTVQDLVNFCVLVQVVDEQQWQRLENERSSTGRSRISRGPDDRDYIFAQSEEFWRMDGERRATPQRLQSVLASNRRVVLRGEPGEGKTTSLFLHVAHQCGELAEGLRSRKFGLASPECRVPLPLPLSKAAPSESGRQFSAIRRAQNEALRIAYGSAKQAPPEVTEWLQEKVTHGEIDLCLDALDELDVRWHDSLRKELERDDPQRQCEIRVFLTTRMSADDTKVLRNAQRFRMVCFGPTQVRDYITRYFTHVENGEQLARELRDQLRLSPGPRHLAQIPLLLALLCEWLSSRWQWPIEKIRQEMPKTRTKLLGNALHRLMERGDARRNNPVADPPSRRNQIKEAVLRHVAWRFFATGPLPIVKHDLMPVLEQQLERPKWKRYAPPQNAEALLEEYLQDGVFVRQDQGVYRFVLRSLHEYCLAGWIARECPLVKADDPDEFTAMIRGRSMEWGRRDWSDIKPLNQPTWENVWPFVARQLAEKSSWLFDALFRELSEREDVFDTRLLLIARIAHEVEVDSPEMREIDNLLLEKYFNPQKNYYWNWKNREQFSSALRGLVAARPRIREAMLATVVDLDSRAWGHEGCVEILRESGDASMRAVFAELLRNPLDEPHLRMACATALGEAGEIASRDVLIDQLRNAEVTAPQIRPDMREHDANEIRGSCAQALSNYHDDQCAEALMEQMGKSVGSKRLFGACVKSLADSAGPKAGMTLTSFLARNDVDDETRFECAEALGRIGDQSAHDTLAKALVDTNYPAAVRCACALELARLDDDRCIEYFADFLNEEQITADQRRKVAGALGELRLSQFRLPLLGCLLDSQRSQNPTWECARALTQLEGDESKETLIDILRDPTNDRDTKWPAVSAMEDLRDERFRLVLLDLVSQRDTESTVRWSALRALQEWGPHEPTRLRLRELAWADGNDDEFRWNCIEGLAALGDNEMRDAIIGRLNDASTHPEIRRRCVKALISARVLDRRASDGALKVLDEPLHEIEIRPIVEWLVNLDDENVIVELFRRSTDEEKYSHNVRDCMKEELFRAQLRTGRRMLVTGECEAP